MDSFIEDLLIVDTDIIMEILEIEEYNFYDNPFRFSAECKCAECKKTSMKNSG